MTRKGFNTLQGRFRFLCPALSRSIRVFPAPVFTYAFRFPKAASGRGCVRAAVGTQQKPKSIRPSCQVLLVRINQRAGNYKTRSGPWWQRGRVFHSGSAEATRAAEPAGSLPPLSRPSAPPLFPAERLSGDVTSGLQGHPSTPQPGLGGGLHFRNLRPALPSRCARAPGPPAQAECAARSAAHPWGCSFLPRAPKWLCNALIPSLFKIYYFAHRGFFSWGGGTNFA